MAGQDALARLARLHGLAGGDVLTYLVFCL